MSSKEPYKLNLSGGKITVKNQQISEEVALKVIALLMGGVAQSSTGQEPSDPYMLSAPALHGAQGDTLTPKDFMAQKKPLSEIERMTCLAYYLATYRDTAAFKTRDLTKLNQEAAQPNFSNAAAFARNADIAGYLAKAGGGSKQITSLGDAIVKALPDREQVKKAIADNAPGRKRRNKSKKSRGKKK